MSFPAALGALFSLPAAALWLVLVLHVLICLLLILVVLLQARKGQDLASAFGAGPTQTNVAALSAEDFLSRATKYGAIMFMATSLILARYPPGKRPSALDVTPDETLAPATVKPAPGSTTSATQTTTPPAGGSAAGAPASAPAPPAAPPSVPAPAPASPAGTPASPAPAK